MSEIDKIQGWLDEETAKLQVLPNTKRAIEVSIGRKMLAEMRAMQEARRGEISINLLTKNAPVFKVNRPIKRMTK